VTFDIDLHGGHPGGEQLVTEDSVDVRVGQLWRRRRDGKAFIPAHRAADGWVDRSGIRRTAVELRDGYVLVQPTERHGHTVAVDTVVGRQPRNEVIDRGTDTGR
jgi:hypothetical protein